MENSRVMSYFNGISRENMEKDEAIELVKKSQAGDIEARNSLILNHVSLVISITRKYNNLGIENDELINEGILGLAESIDKFEVEKGTAFSTYAYFYILKAVHSYVLNYKHQKPMHSKIAKYEKQFMLEHERQPSIDELAAHFKCSVKSMKHIKSTEVHIESLQGTDDSNYLNDEDKVSKSQQDFDKLSNVDNTLDCMVLTDMFIVIDDILDSLPEKQSYIIKKITGLVDGKRYFLKDLKEELNISYGEVSKLYHGGLNLLKEALLDRGYDETVLAMFN